MRRLAPALLLATCASGAFGQQPPKLEPLPEPPPPPPMSASDEPRVRIPVQDSEQVEEIRDGSRILMLKVTPRGGGTPYYLVDIGGNGHWVRRESLDSGLRVPMWPLHTFD
jgi:hypothetical protein